MKESVVITGGSGLLAVNWALAIRDRYRVVLGLHQREISPAGVAVSRINLESVDDLQRSFAALQPRLIVHTAGLTNVEACEASPELAHHINVRLAENVARASAGLAVPLIHVSTDHLGSGETALMDEDTPVEPLNVYAKTKAEAEIRVFDSHSDALVIRTNFFGWGPSYRRSFSDLIIDKLRAGEDLTLFQDVFYTPIFTSILVRAAHNLVERDAHGIFNVVGDERVSKYEFGRLTAQTFNLDSTLIKPGLLSNHDLLVQRPHDMSLSNQKATSLLARKLGGVAEQLGGLLQQEKLGIAHEVQKL